MNKDICKSFPITEEEYKKLDEKFGALSHYIGWQLYRRNSKNNHTEDHFDIVQDLTLAILRASSYYKRQIYIEKCLKLCYEYSDGKLIKNFVKSLQYLWDNRTRHGAGRQKFGWFQERLLYRLTRKIVPKNVRPNKRAELTIDNKFITYCKAITWNAQKSMGRKITKEKVVRNNQVSISQFDYLGADME